ncbi:MULTISPECIES: DUF3526 domain-containing protein [unclassified Duganella]|uniref:DUF3526 domain-containing protein n=1 Tax=unclassified Duganella TaxID=2636909 RepID=UPI0008854F53|nr:MULTISPECIES: DUF3526 domain-containing protein [unclassified Duganella]SDF74152.1 ABC-2 type transport system permease protein [Duganella sp. OV458]SDI55349.1 ABC-2 type transport system permease protein [Duganella sp. OV510]
MATHTSTMLHIVVRQQWRIMARDGRLRWLLLALLLVFAASLTAAAGRANLTLAQQQRDAVSEAEVWAAQGEANPHGAAHFGRYVYKPWPPLAVLDPGLLNHLGSTLRLEGHVQNTGRYKPTDRGFALSRFDGLNPAAVLQTLVPLLIVFAAFTTFSGTRSRALLAQELGAGASSRLLAAGRFAAFAIGLGGLALATGVLCAVWLGARGDWPLFGSLLLMLGACYVHWLVFLALVMAISAHAENAGASLLRSLGLWAVVVVLLPMLAPQLAEQRYPTPGATAFHKAVEREIMEGPDGHDTRDVRLGRLEAETLKAYGVQKIADLPINFDGLVFEHGEQRTTGIYTRHFAQLYDDHAAQARFSLAASVLSPMLALRPLSAALAQSDLPAHRHFLEQAERYRYAMVQALNRDMKLHRKGNGLYTADVNAITAGIQFAPQSLAMRDVAPRIVQPLLILLAWLIAALLLLWRSASQLGGKA